MTIPRMEAIGRRWAKRPPLSVTVAAIAASLGFEFGKPQYDDIGDLVGQLGGVDGFTLEMNRG